jgi:hypothetical protein
LIDDHGSAVTGLDPNLADNGGPTLPHALLEGSNAIDAGDNALAVDPDGNPLTTDQRGPGFDRIVKRKVDIGAFEFNAGGFLPGQAVQIATLISQIESDPDLPDSLTSTLDNALKKLTDANTKNVVAAVNTLEAFINELEAQSGKKISETDADSLIDQAQEIIDELNAAL